MITSELVEIEYTNNNKEIEKCLNKMGIESLRWAIVGIENNKLIVSVSYEKT